MSAIEPRVHFTTKVRHTSMCQPAVRMVVVEAGVNTIEPGVADVWYCIYPVFALVAMMLDRYSASAKTKYPPDTSPKHSDMLEAGWSYDGEDQKFDFLICSDNTHLLLVSDESNQTESTTREILAAPWDASEDEEQLKDVIQRVRERALTKAKQYQREKQIKKRQEEIDFAALLS